LREIDLGPASAIPFGEGRETLVDGESIAVFRLRNGAVYAIQAQCPHEGGSLAEGVTGGLTVICPIHGRKFNLETGMDLHIGCSLKTYPVRLCEEGNVFLGVNAAS
jgi:nitrite reductase (NADH) small subunit